MDRLDLIYYSPTHTTQKIVREIGRNIECEIHHEINLTCAGEELLNEAGNGDLTIVGMPVYAGRIPKKTVDQLKCIRSADKPVVLVVVYGNRHYDDALLELKDIMTACGFNIIAAAAFIGEHSYSTKEFPVAAGRPDSRDLEIAADFSKEIQQKINHLTEIKSVVSPEIPGNFPYRNGFSRQQLISPETNNSKCNFCGVCAKVCPTNAIVLNQQVVTNKERCTWCCACIKSCPSEARTFESKLIKGFSQKLNANCSIRKEPEFFV